MDASGDKLHFSVVHDRKIVLLVLMPMACPNRPNVYFHQQNMTFNQRFRDMNLTLYASLSRWRQGFESQWGCEENLPKRQ
jgi:hypothetical protein